MTFISIVIFSICWGVSQPLLHEHTTATTPITLQQLQNQILQNLNQETLLRLELERKLHAVEARLETLETASTKDKQTIDNLTMALAQANAEIQTALANTSSTLGNRLTLIEQKVPQLAKKEPAVVFLAILSQLATVNKPGPLIFDTTKFNIGGGYNTLDGMFTAPVSGVYSFSVTLAGGNNIDTHGYLMLNGAQVGYIFADIRTTDKLPKGSTSTSVHCNSGDKVWFQVIDSNDQQIYPWKYTYFTGHLVHMDQ